MKGSNLKLQSLSTFVMFCIFAPYGAAQNKPNVDMPTTALTNTSTVNQDAHFFSIPHALRETILNDSENRVQAAFKVPPAIKPLVDFWLQIYGQYSAYQALIHDRENPALIYEVVDLRDLFLAGRSAVVLELEIKARLQKKIAKYQAAFLALASGTKQRSAVIQTPEYQRIVTLIPNNLKQPRHRYLEYKKRMRVQTGLRDRVIDGIQTAKPFFSAMEDIFKNYNIPTDITRLCLVESSFNTHAISKAAAVGVWQFLERSAIGEGMIVKPGLGIDERRSAIKSTIGAAKMMKRNYRILDDWGLAIIAYNHGPKNLVPLRKTFKGDQFIKLLDPNFKSPLGFASKNYYAEFIAMLHAERYRQELFGIENYPENYTTEMVTIDRPVNMFSLSTRFNIPLYRLKQFNPDVFKLDQLLPKGTRIVLPKFN